MVLGLADGTLQALRQARATIHPRFGGRIIGRVPFLPLSGFILVGVVQETLDF
jgi:hypothetical protein